MDKQLWIYRIGLTLLPGIGSVLAKQLVSYCGGVESVYRVKQSHLTRIPGIGPKIASAISRQQVLSRAEEEVDFIERQGIQPLFYLDDDYPKRLKHCVDSPLVLYYKGSADLNQGRVLSIVGTRRATSYGKLQCEQLLDHLKECGILISSGLAYGIDICAHKQALKTGMDTVAVLGHGLDRIYPYIHKKTAEAMTGQGGLLTEFPSKTIPDRENFPKRNRIIAGMADATLVMETGKKGGSMITARLADSYNRDVFAFPGRASDPLSEGCNLLIKSNVAALVESATDLQFLMGWEPLNAPKSSPRNNKQAQLLLELSLEEKSIIGVLQEKGAVPIDDIVLQSQMHTSKVAGILLNLEFMGVLRSLPGKIYQLL